MFCRVLIAGLLAGLAAGPIKGPSLAPDPRPLDGGRKGVVCAPLLPAPAATKAIRSAGANLDRRSACMSFSRNSQLRLFSIMIMRATRNAQPLGDKTQCKGGSRHPQ